MNKRFTTVDAVAFYLFVAVGTCFRGKLKKIHYDPCPAAPKRHQEERSLIVTSMKGEEAFEDPSRVQWRRDRRNLRFADRRI